MKTKLNIIREVWLLAVVVLITACNNQWDNHVEVDTPTLDGSVLDAVKANKDLSAFYLLLEETGYVNILNGEYEYTILAPDNDAISELVANYEEGEWNEQEKLAIVKNHIAFGLYNMKTLTQPDSRLKMINGKNQSMSTVSFDSEHSNVLCNNGVLHIVDKAYKPLMNIDEYLQYVRGMFPEEYEQLDSLYAKATKVMDTERSVQTGVNELGQPVYDTVWTTRNYFFEEMPINDEDSSYTFVVLRDLNFRELKAKYARYMSLGDEEQTDSLVVDELIRDLVFKQGETTALSGVKVDFSGAADFVPLPIEVSEYKASNGVVRFLNGVDVKMKENKIKTVVVEAEDYLSAYSPSKVYTRSRSSWASGGKDVMVSSRTYQKDPVTGTEYSFVFNTSNYNTDMNFYLLYEVRLNSVTYDVYWLSYDDMAEHIAKDPASEASTLVVCQKMFAAMPGDAQLARSSGGSIQNNYWGNSVAFAAYSVAGDKTYRDYPVQLRKYTLDTGSSRMIPKEEVEGEERYDFDVPRMGKVQLMVCNTAGFHPYSKANQSGGMMFLDYIKFVPRIPDGE